MRRRFLVVKEADPAGLAETRKGPTERSQSVQISSALPAGTTMFCSGTISTRPSAKVLTTAAAMPPRAPPPAPNADSSVLIAARRASSEICATKACTVRFMSFWKSLIVVSLFRSSGRSY